MADYIPQADGDFDSYQAAFISYATANMAALGLVAANITTLTTAQTAWSTSFAAHNAAQFAAQSARTAKDGNKETLIDALREMTNKIQGFPNTTDVQRSALGITVRDTTPTEIGAPTTRPVGNADTSQRFQITLAWSDETTPTSRAKPHGVLGAEIYVKIDGPPPTDVDDCEFLAMDTRAPYVAHFDGSDGNKTAHFILRWINSRGERGPVSETVSATIPA